MDLKGSGEGSLTVVDRFDGGVGWIAYPDEPMRRASHALAVPNGGGDTDVWVIDPVDAPGLDDLLDEYGEVAGVVCCLDRHIRDAATIATRHGVSVAIPEWMTGVATGIDAPVRLLGDRLPGTEYRTIRLRDSSVPRWQEVGLFDGETLVVPESVGTTDFYCAPGERLGVHPLLRPIPPTEALAGLDPDRILVGHGAGVFENASVAVSDALAGSRRTAPRLYCGIVRSLLDR